MRKLVVQQWVTVDNIAAEEDGGLSFVAGEPFDDTVTDNPFQNEIMAFIESVDTMVIGANTYTMSKAYWPNATEQGAYGEKFNSLAKVVVSSTLAEAPWGDFPAGTVTPDPAATIGELKRQEGKDLLLWGSLQLMHSLLTAGLVDELRLLVCPTSRGKGARIFENRQDLKPIEATAFDNGVVLLRYAIKK